MKPLIMVAFSKKLAWAIPRIFILFFWMTLFPYSVKSKKATVRTPIKTVPISKTPIKSSHQQCHSRYACLGAKVNWRSGPGSDHDVLWHYESPDWPVVLLKKYNNWYYVKDYTGELGWIKGSMLRFKTTLLIKKDTTLNSKERKGSPAKALLKKGAIVRYIKHTDGQWLYVMEPENHLYGWILSDVSWPNPASP